MQPKEIKLQTKINHNRRGKTNGLGSKHVIFRGELCKK